MEKYVIGIKNNMFWVSTFRVSDGVIEFTVNCHKTVRDS